VGSAKTETHSDKIKWKRLHNRTGREKIKKQPGGPEYIDKKTRRCGTYRKVAAQEDWRKDASGEETLKNWGRTGEGGGSIRTIELWYLKKKKGHREGGGGGGGGRGPKNVLQKKAHGVTVSPGGRKTGRSPTRSPVITVKRSKQGGAKKGKADP